jgi:hypothetical protein
MLNLKDVLLRTAEIFDAWRVIPRIVLVLYSSLVFSLYLWYRSIPTYVQEQCDGALMQTLLDRGMELEAVEAVACTVVDIVGGPTMAQSTFVTTIIGLSTGIFGLYVATGRKWDKFGYYDRFPHPSFPDNGDNGWGWGRRPGRGPGYGPYPPYGPYGPPYAPFAEGEEDAEVANVVGPDGPSGPEFKPSDNGPKWENPFGDDETSSPPTHPDPDVK